MSDSNDTKVVQQSAESVHHTKEVGLEHSWAQNVAESKRKKIEL